jgi:hypothetical protein
MAKLNRVIFDTCCNPITERAEEWYGPIRQTVIFEGFGAPVLREPEHFLQLMEFSEWSELELSGALLPNRTMTKRSIPANLFCNLQFHERG